MTCGDKFNKNCPTYGSRVDPAEVDGRPLCTYPLCGKRLLGSGECVDGHSQNPADWRTAAGRATAALVAAAECFPNFSEADGQRVALFHQGQPEVLCRAGATVYTYRFAREGGVVEEMADGFPSTSEAARALDDYVAAASRQGAQQHCPRCGQFMSMAGEHQCPALAGEQEKAAGVKAVVPPAAPLPFTGPEAMRQVAAHVQALLELDQELEAAQQQGEPREFEIAVTRIGYGHNTITVEARSEREAIAQAVDEAGDYDYSEHESEYEPEEDCGLREINAARDWLSTVSAETDTAEGKQALQTLVDYLTAAAVETGRTDDPRLQAAREYLAAATGAGVSPQQIDFARLERVLQRIWDEAEHLAVFYDGEMRWAVDTVKAAQSAPAAPVATEPAPALPRGTVVLAPAEAEKLGRLLNAAWDKLNIANGMVDPYGDEEGEPPDEDGVARFVPEGLLDALAEWERRVEQPHPVISAAGGSTPQPAAAPAPPTEWRRDNLPYAAVSVSPGEGRAMEWKKPLWEAINRLADTPPTQRVPLVNDVEAAVEQAMVLALNTAAAAKMLDTVPTEPFPRHWPEGAEWYYPGNATFLRVVDGQLLHYDPPSKTWKPSAMTRTVASEGISIRRPLPAAELPPTEEQDRAVTTEE